MILIAGGGFNPFFHSEHREMSKLRLLNPYPKVAINPKLAEKMSIKEGEWLWIETPVGKIKQKAMITPAVAPDTIQAERGWWYPEKDIAAPSLMGAFESNISVCLDDDPDTLDQSMWQLEYSPYHVPD